MVYRWEGRNLVSANIHILIVWAVSLPLYMLFRHRRELSYSSTNSWSWHLVEVSCQLHAPAALLLLSIEWQAEWDSQPVWIVGNTQKLLAIGLIFIICLPQPNNYNTWAILSALWKLRLRLYWKLVLIVCSLSISRSVAITFQLNHN